MATTTPAGHGVELVGNVLRLTDDLSTVGTLTVVVRVTETGEGFGGGDGESDGGVGRGCARCGVAAFGSPVVVEPDLVAGDAVLTLSVSGGDAALSVYDVYGYGFGGGFVRGREFGERRGWRGRQGRGW